jgi:hypothetical protein
MWDITQARTVDSAILNTSKRTQFTYLGTNERIYSSRSMGTLYNTRCEGVERGVVYSCSVHKYKSMKHMPLYLARGNRMFLPNNLDISYNGTTKHVQKSMLCS